jgi:hypothetical protein
MINNANKIFGKTWETEVFNIFKDAELDIWHLGFTERADLLIVAKKDRIIECKATHEAKFDFKKNKKQHDKFIRYLKEHKEISGYYAFKFIANHKSYKFLIYALDTENLKYLSPLNKDIRQISFEEVISHIKEEL